MPFSEKHQRKSQFRSHKKDRFGQQDAAANRNIWEKKLLRSDNGSAPTPRSGHSRGHSGLNHVLGYPDANVTAGALPDRRQPKDHGELARARQKNRDGAQVYASSAPKASRRSLPLINVARLATEAAESNLTRLTCHHDCIIAECETPAGPEVDSEGLPAAGLRRVIWSQTRRTIGASEAGAYRAEPKQT